MTIYSPGRPNKYCPETGEGTLPPHKPGEYRIRNEEGEITYVGETNDLKRRMGEHTRTGKMSGGMNENGTFEYKVADGRSTSRTRREHEREKIEQHNPIYNKSSGGEGRPAGKRAVG